MYIKKENLANMNMCMTKIRSNSVSKSFISDLINEMKKEIIDRLTHTVLHIGSMYQNEHEQ